MSRQDYILTYTKTRFTPLSPEMDQIKIEDIAHALSFLCRANGHFKHFYSVAQHSIHCCKEAKARGYSPRIQFACLLHDASEAYLSDITRPVKQHLQEYIEFEKKLQTTIYHTFFKENLTEDEIIKVRQIDDHVLYFEFYALAGAYLPISNAYLKYEQDYSFQEFSEVSNQFLNLFKELNSQISLHK